MVQALAEAGAQVAIVSRNQADCESVAQAIQTETKSTCRGYGCDVTVPDQVTATVNQVIEDFGQIDIVVNNAGLNIRRPIEELSVEEFQQVQAINVTGPWLVCRAVAPCLALLQPR